MMRRAALTTILLAAALAPATAHAALPQLNYTLDGPVGANGWFVGPVTINWQVSGATSSDNCTFVETLRADTQGIQRSCTVSNADGPITATTKVIKLDQTPPTSVAVASARPPDAPPFYTKPVPIAWSGTDATSGVAACTSITYSGPDVPNAAPSGACRDNAGNVSAPVALTFAYDATAPPLTGLVATAGADRVVALTWATSPDAQTVTVVRNPGAVVLVNAGPATTHALGDGPLAPATAFTYTVTVKDAAGNVTSATASATTPAPAPDVASKSTAKGNTTTKPKLPTLRWKARPRARYYNIQLFRNGRKVLSRWPTKNHYTLHAQWHYRGRIVRLATGRYRWYVWPGYGRRTAHRYGRLHAKGAVVIPSLPAP